MKEMRYRLSFPIDLITTAWIGTAQDWLSGVVTPLSRTQTTAVADPQAGFPRPGRSRSSVSEESIPERGGRKNVSGLARSYHVATSCAIFACAFLSGMITVVIYISPRRARIYPPTLVSSNAPRACSDAFCAAERPRMPVILSRS